MKGGHMNDAIVTQLLDTKLLPIGKQEKPKYFNDINFAIKKCVCINQTSVDFGKFISKVCRLIRYKEKCEKNCFCNSKK